MVLGLRSKHRKGASIQLDYLVHVQEIKPWPPSQSLKSSRSVVLHWENGDQNSGSLTSEVGEVKIEFNESFTLPLTLHRDKKVQDKFQKNFLEFHLHETRKDKAKLLGTATINLAEYGILDEILILSAPFNLKKSSKITVQPVLFVKIQPTDRYSSAASSVTSLSKQASLEKDVQESELLNKEIDDDSIASFTDDDVSSHSSRTVESSVFEATGASPSQTEKNGSAAVYSGGRVNEEPNLLSRGKPATTAAVLSPPILLSKELNGSSNVSPSIRGDVQQSVQDNYVNRRSGKTEIEASNIQVDLNSNVTTSRSSLTSRDDSGRAPQLENNEQVKAIIVNNIGLDDRNLDEQKKISEDNLVGKFLEARNKNKLRSNTLASNRNIPRAQGNTSNSNKLKHLNSVQLPKGGPFSGNSQIKEKVNKSDKPESASNNLEKNGIHERKELKNGSKVELKSRVETLEEELREAAAIEVSLYSIVAEHGGSTNKVHAPARRLSRFYLHACKGSSQDTMANVARAAISGLALVSKACGNDVPRLTFWLSNSTMLRAIVSRDVGDMSRLGKREESSATGENGGSQEVYDDWKHPETFIIALEKVEAWIFSRIVQSVWWQTLTPHMQSTAAKASSKSTGHNSRKGKNSFGDQEQGKFSIELWKKAFKDACERLCPVRAGGHECGCLPALARLVMQQLVGRLDVAMFNAVLRESADEMPTDPVSDPIADSKVLPVPAGRSSFGAGAQLKNAIGSWSLWLTDLFGIEDNDDLIDEKRIEPDTSFKPFRLLNSLSDLMMIPCEMLADKSIRKEVCPTLSASLIRQVVYSSVPDEFCPNPVPEAVLDALDAEDYSSEASEEGLTSYPCIATPTVYTPPPAAALAHLVGETGSQALRRSGSSVLKKSYTSDDELDELDSPLTSIITGNFHVSSVLTRPNWTPRGGRNVVRYQLLREVWRDGD